MMPTENNSFTKKESNGDATSIIYYLNEKVYTLTEKI